MNCGATGQAGKKNLYYHYIYTFSLPTGTNVEHSGSVHFALIHVPSSFLLVRSQLYIRFIINSCFILLPQRARE